MTNEVLEGFGRKLMTYLYWNIHGLIQLGETKKYTIGCYSIRRKFQSRGLRFQGMRVY